MPLSEHEQKILAELEESLSKQDPRFAKNVRETNVYSHGGRRVRWGILGFVAGLLILVLFFSQSTLLGLFGVALMFVSAVVIERNARLLGRAPGRTSRVHRKVTTPTRTWVRGPVRFATGCRVSATRANDRRRVSRHRTSVSRPGHRGVQGRMRRR